MLSSNDFKRLILHLSRLMKFSPNFQDDDIATSYYKALRGFDRDKLEEACILATRTLNEFPSIKQLYDLCQGNVLNDEEVGENIAKNIMHCIGDFGYDAMSYNHPRRNELMLALGETALEVVKDFSGGWSGLCTRAENMRDGSFLRDEIREAAKIKHKKINVLGKDEPMRLPQSPVDAKPAVLNRALRIAKGEE